MSAPIASLKMPCQWCGKTAEETKRSVIGSKVIISLKCGHTIIRDKGKVELCEITSRKGQSPYPYQIKSAEFFEQAGLSGICGHEMGVGKTVVECIMLLRNRKAMLPMLIVCKSGLRYQWWLELINWTGIVAQIIQGGKEKPQFDLFDVFIVSYDTLRMLRPDIDREYEMMANASLVGEEGFINRKGRRVKAPKIVWDDETCSQFKHICLDECQMIKNPDASRTRAIKKIASGWQRIGSEANGSIIGSIENAPTIMGLSGTAIKNDASEYATILHMVRPEVFPSEMGFIAHDCRQVGNSNRFALRDPDNFHEKTKDFILRYERKDVLPELPSISRMFYHAELEGGDLEAYKRVVKEFQEFMEEKEDLSAKDMTNILGYFARMRRITGIAKVAACVEFIEEFLLSTDRKIVIFVHHKDVGDMLFSSFLKLTQEAAMDEPLMLVSSLSSEQRMEVVNDFKGVRGRTEMRDGKLHIIEEPTGKNHRIMIASTLAAGEGLNLQFCADCIIMERQWNPANEEQAEARFPRPGQTADKINATYLIAAGSIDDFLTELVERKRAIVKNTLTGENYSWDESSLMKELAQTLATKGLKKWEAPR